MPTSERPTSEETGAVWGSEHETLRDEKMGDGNLFVSRLLRPAVADLLRPGPGQRVLDVACGNGVFARWLADQGAWWSRAT